MNNKLLAYANLIIAVVLFTLGVKEVLLGNTGWVIFDLIIGGINLFGFLINPYK